MFRGINSVVLDAKGRLALPTRFRETLQERCGGHMVITIDSRERCLLLYPLPEWEKVQQGLEGLANLKRNARVLQRLLIGHATDVEADGNGRLLIPPPLREHAALSKKVVLLGQGNKIEVWSDELWQVWRTECLKERANDSSDDSDDFTGLSV